MRGKFAFQTDRGRIRRNNEDNTIALKNSDGDVLMLVLDGMGGHQKGDVASKVAIEYLQKRFESKRHFFTFFEMKNWLSHNIKKANTQVNRLAETKLEYKDMGTTLVGVMIRDKKTLLVNIGDSRAYIFKNNEMIQISEDQTYVQFLYKTGKITKEEIKTHPKRHVLMNALGTYPGVSISMKTIKKDYQYLLLCSDGLYNTVDEHTISSIIYSSLTIEQKCNELIRHANSLGGPDNIAVCLWEVEK